MRVLNSERSWSRTSSDFFDAASARPRASVARASADVAFSSAALMRGSASSSCFCVFWAFWSTWLSLVFTGSIDCATYFLVAQPPNNATVKTKQILTSRFIASPCVLNPNYYCTANQQRERQASSLLSHHRIDALRQP